MAKLYGVRKVIAAISTREAGDCRKAGGTQPERVQKVKEMTDGKGVDLIVETASGDVANQAFDVLVPFERIVFLGQSSGKSAQIDPWRLSVHNHSVIGICGLGP